MGLKSVGTKITIHTAIMLILTCVIVTFISYRIGRSCIGEMLQNTHLPSVMENISAVVDKNIMTSADGLALVADNPFLVQWITEGENPDDLAKVYDLLRGVCTNYKTNGANVVLWDSKTYYDLRDNKESVRQVTDDETWFKEFKDSGDAVSINVYVNDKTYGSVAFINRRIEKDNRFIGLTSVAINIDAFIKNVTEKTVGATGETYMVDKAGIIRLHKNPDMINTVTLADKMGWADHHKEVLSKEQSSFTMDKNGEPTIAMAQFNPVLGWYLVVEANEAELIKTACSEILDDMSGAFFALLIASLFLLIAAVIAGLFFSSRIVSRPINETVNRIKDIAQGEGDLTMRLPVNSNDEIGALANWLNIFMERLQGIVSHISSSAKM